MEPHMTQPLQIGFLLFPGLTQLDLTGPAQVLSRTSHSQTHFVAKTLEPVPSDCGLSLMPTKTFEDCPPLDLVCIPGGVGVSVPMRDEPTMAWLRAQGERAQYVTSVCTGSWIYGRMGLLDGIPATNRKEPDRVEASHLGKLPIDRLAEIAPACRISHARVVDAGRIVTAGGIASGMELGFHLLRRAGYDEGFIRDVARCMEYSAAYDTYAHDIEYAPNPVPCFAH